MRFDAKTTRLILAGCLAAYFPARAVERSKISIRWNTNSAPLQVEVYGLSKETLHSLQTRNRQLAEWNKVLSVYAAQGEFIADMSVPPMLGSYSIQEPLLRFQPRYPLERGVTYRAVFRPAGLPGFSSDGIPSAIVSTFTLPALNRNPTTSVTHIYPSNDRLPENLLKFYVHFSASMQGGHIYDHIHLRDQAGKLVDLPFLEIDEELWNPEMTRLTLFIDPGRIKRGVTPLEEIGPALEEGKQYTLEIDSAWLDSAGMPLREIFRKTFRVIAPDREPPLPSTWKIAAPKAGTRDSLKLDFFEPMDHALAQRVIRVSSAKGNMVEGTISLSDREQRWSFLPKHPWVAGEYQIQVQNTIEDLAGNNIGKVFEVDLFESVQKRFTNAVVPLKFEVRE